MMDNHINAAAPTSEHVVAIYIRLSKEDDDLRFNMDKSESNSITNQRMLIMDFMNEHKEEFAGCKIIEKCDDGFSGKKFDRPEFLELIEMAKKGAINCIIVKDFSRFGRDYVELGDYLEQVFPFLGIRFISVNDKYDSDKNGNGTAGIDVVFKNFVYDLYSRDTSKKIRNVRQKLAKEGSFASANAPYGYLKSREDRHKLVMNPETALVVKEIFDLKLTGISAAQITTILNGRGIPSPAQYAIDKGIGMDWRRINEKTAWNDSGVMAILRDERYVGHMISLKRTLKGIYGKDTKVDKEKWVKVENTHEGIITEEVYHNVQSMLNDFEKPYKGTRFNPFICGCCGRKLSLSKQKTYFLCRYGETNPQAICYKVRYDAKELHQVILGELLWHFEQFLKVENILEKCKQKRVPVADNVDLYRKSRKLLSISKTSLYERYKDGEISKEEYLKQRQELDLKIREYEELILQNDLSAEKGEEQNSEFIKVSKLVHQYLGTEELTIELQEAFIERVIVYSADRVKIVWRFADVFDMIGSEVVTA